MLNSGALALGATITLSLPWYLSSVLWYEGGSSWRRLAGKGIVGKRSSVKESSDEDGEDGEALSEVVFPRPSIIGGEPMQESSDDELSDGVSSTFRAGESMKESSDDDELCESISSSSSLVLGNCSKGVENVTLLLAGFKIDFGAFGGAFVFGGTFDGFSGTLGLLRTAFFSSGCT